MLPHSLTVPSTGFNSDAEASRSALIGDELAAGRLVRPFALSLPASFAYYLVYPPRALKRPSVKAFRDWLMSVPRAENGPSMATAKG